MATRGENPCSAPGPRSSLQLATISEPTNSTMAEGDNGGNGRC
jgi:hypothetical protein